ncbi:hypothetical protein FNW02_30025 [Komarekiella sp. 'clone 1']|uniref:Uncharacterized protein n=1 Tax=Komarekiella delphini-convector SJRDD-AB1 TaxID=2593771 RepID=A0AA40T2W1_9NOST|nr:hypothetical protein [Komarekiella delphini-convector]MBD6619928.1 hypothetical protein [Komarekiella delphini-convector SJRDD-AB1]
MISSLCGVVYSFGISAFLLLNSFYVYDLMQSATKESNLYYFSQIATPSQNQASEKSTESQKPWYEVSNILSLGALIVAILAAVSSQRSATAEEIRAKKEELRQIIVQLLEFQENFNSTIIHMQDEQARMYAGIILNNKKLIYLEAAELVAKQIPNHVSSPEYVILAAENYYDSDFVQARSYYKKAVKAAKRSSIIMQAYALRELASNYFVSGTLQDVEQARKHFREAIDALKNEVDPYSIYCQGITYRSWAYSEIYWGDKLQAASTLENAKALFFNLPTGYVYKEHELNLTANLYQQLAISYFNTGKDKDIEEGRKIFLAALDVISHLADTNSIYLKTGQIYQEWGQQENSQKFGNEGRLKFQLAKQEYLKLPAQYPLRDQYLKYIEEMINTVL